VAPLGVGVGGHSDGPRGRRVGIDEVRRPDRHRRSPGKEEFDRVVAVHDPPHADDRHLHRLRHIPHHADRDRLERRPRESAGAVGDARPPGLDVDRHPRNRVDERNHVAARIHRRPREIGDAGHIRAQFGDERQLCLRPDQRNHLMRQVKVGPEGDAARFHVRAGDVDFKRGDPVALGVEAFGHFAVLGDGLAPDVDDGRRPHAAQEGQIVFAVEEGVHPRPLQADGVEHSAGHLRHARRGVPRRRLHADSLHHHRAETRNVVVLMIFIAVAEGPRRGHHRVLQRERPEFAGQIRHNLLHIYRIEVENRAVGAGPGIGPAFRRVGLDFHHAGETGADAAAHQVVDGELAGLPLGLQQLRQRHQHRVRSAAVEEEVVVRPLFEQLLHQPGDEAAIPPRPVVGGDADVVPGLLIGLGQQHVAFAAGAQEEEAALRNLLGQHESRRRPVAARDKHRRDAGRGFGEGNAERPHQVADRPRLQLREPFRAVADDLVDHAERVALAVLDAERAAQDAVAAIVDPDMDELPGLRLAADLRRMEADQEIVPLEPAVFNDFTIGHIWNSVNKDWWYVRVRRWWRGRAPDR